MLVLTRKPERGDELMITIGDGIEIKVVKVDGDQVRRGITAPAEIAVWRRELWIAKQVSSEQPNK